MPNSREERTDSVAPWPLAVLMISATSACLFTGVHSVVYNWAFLVPYNLEHGWTLFLEFETLQAYWNWRPGRLLIYANMLAVALPFVLLKGIDILHRHART